MLDISIFRKCLDFEKGGFDTPFTTTAQGYSTTEVKMNLSSFLLSSLFTPSRFLRLRGEKR